MVSSVVHLNIVWLLRLLVLLVGLGVAFIQMYCGNAAVVWKNNVLLPLVYGVNTFIVWNVNGMDVAVPAIVRGAPTLLICSNTEYTPLFNPLSPADALHVEKSGMSLLDGSTFAAVAKRMKTASVLVIRLYPATSVSFPEGLPVEFAVSVSCVAESMVSIRPMRT